MKFCGISVGRIVVGIFLSLVSILLIYWIAVAPEERPIALVVLFDIIFIYFKLWKFLPWERSHVKGEGEKVVSLRLGGHDSFTRLKTLLTSPARGNENREVSTTQIPPIDRTSARRRETSTSPFT